MNNQNNFLPTQGTGMTDEQCNTFFHAVNSGDLIANLPGMRMAYRRNGKKARIYQRLNQPGNYYEGATHPLRDAAGNMVTMNRKMFDMLRPLLIVQPYIDDFRPHEGEKCAYDLNRIHTGINVNMPHGSINRWNWYIYPDLACNLAEKWIFLPEQRINFALRYDNQVVWTDDLSDKFIINFTERYRIPAFKYYFLRAYQQHCIFLGTEKEYEKFCGEWKLELPFLIIGNFLEAAQALKSAKFFMGNQSMFWNVCEGMKTPRILERCGFALNCIPVGECALDYDREGACEFYVQELMGREKIFLTCPVCQTENFTSFIKHNTDYAHCSECGTIYSKMLMQSDKIGGEDYEGRDQNNMNRIERFKELGITTLLDFGCGHGELIEASSGSGMQVLGYDKYNPDYSRYPDTKVDCVALVEVIEHMTYPFSELDAINKSLNDGGFLYVETSYSDFLDITSDYIDPVKGHCTIFSYKGMDMLMTAKGFELQKVYNRNARVYRKV